APPLPHINTLSLHDALPISPSHHRVHHGINPKYIDRNHAGSLMIWDRLFGTFQEEEERPIYGITTPVNSWNPVMANIQPFVVLFRELITIPGYWNKLKFTFDRPDWYSKEMGGYKPAKEVDESAYRKIEIGVSPTLNFYLFGQYVVILIITAFFLFTLSEYQMTLQLLIAALIIYSVAAVGMLFENKMQAIKLEFIRFIITIALTFYMYYLQLTPIWLPIGISVVAFVSIVAIFKVRFHKLAPLD